MRPFTEEQIKPYILEDGQTVFATLTNSGYLLYTLNLLKSLQPYGLDKKVLVLCMDERAAQRLERVGYRAFVVQEKEQDEKEESKEDLSRFCPWNTKGYDEICYTKLCLIHRILSMNHHILLVDGDVVFRKNPIEEWRGWWSSPSKQMPDVVIQNDSEQEGDTTNLCTGYLWIRSSPHTCDIYDCESEEGRERYRLCAFDNNDQTYFNRYVKPVCHVHVLPLLRYPNGLVYQKRKQICNENAVLVHFNWLKGHLKLVTMKQNGMWRLTPEEERSVIA